MWLPWLLTNPNYCHFGMLVYFESGILLGDEFSNNVKGLNSTYMLWGYQTRKICILKVPKCKLGILLIRYENPGQWFLMVVTNLEKIQDV